MNHVEIYPVWKKINADIFWGEIAPCDHVLQVYENNEAFLGALTGFVTGGFRSEESVIVIATKAHLAALRERLEKTGINTGHLISTHQYIPLDAEDTLAQFMVNGWPDERLFIQTVSAVLEKAGYGTRKIRAFGEMVALLWARNMSGATVHLEHLWNKFCEQHSFCLFCAYPKSGFTDDMSSSIQHICKAHSKIISGTEKQTRDIVYSEME